MYDDALRKQLSPPAQAYWDKHIGFFLGKGWRKSFYYRGTSGLLAKLVLINAQVLHRLREPIQELLDAQTRRRSSKRSTKRRSSRGSGRRGCAGSCRAASR